jgi:hypothetical protein
MKTIKVIIIISTFVLFGIITIPVDNPEINITEMDAIGRTFISLIVIVIGIALWRAADKEEKRWKS